MAKEYDALLTEILASASSAAATAAATILARCLTYRSKYFERKVIKCLPYPVSASPRRMQEHLKSR